MQGNGTKGGNGRREGVLVLVLNGVDGLAWGELERAVSLSSSHKVHLEYGTEYLWLYSQAKSFETSFRTKRS